MTATAPATAPAISTTAEVATRKPIAPSPGELSSLLLFELLLDSPLPPPMRPVACARRDESCGLPARTLETSGFWRADEMSD